MTLTTAERSQIVALSWMLRVSGVARFLGVNVRVLDRLVARRGYGLQHRTIERVREILAHAFPIVEARGCA